MITLLLSICILILSALCVFVMLFKLMRQPTQKLSFLQSLKLIFSGILAFTADALGIGSYAINAVLAKLFGTFHEDELPAVNNGAQVIPGTIEAFFFMQWIDVDVTTLLTLVTGTCIGGVLGGLVEGFLKRQTIRFAMMGSCILIITLLIAHQFLLLPIGGDLTQLHSWSLVIGFFAFLLCGALTAVGVGLFVMVQGVLFLMNVSPLLAFPIMTIAGAMQQPLTSLIFLQKNKIPVKKTLILSLSGCGGVFIALSLFQYLTITWLHQLLLGILLYHLLTTAYSYWRERAVLSVMIRHVERSETSPGR